MTKTLKVARNRRLNRLALTTALSSMSIVGYGRGAYAGGCTVTGTPGTYLCSGPAGATTDMFVRETGTPLNMLLAPGFGIDTSVNGANGEFLYGPGGGNAFFLIGYGGLTIKDQGGTATIIGAYDGVSAVNSLSTVSGDNTLLITASGTSFEGVYYSGLVAQNFGISTNGASNLEITTGDVTGADLALFARNFSVGAVDSNLTINTVAGTVTGGGGSGIYAENNGWSDYGRSDFTVTTADVSSAGRYVINLVNFGLGDLSSDVTLSTSGGHIDGTGADSIGIVVKNLSTTENGTSNVVITTASVTAKSMGMYIQNRSYTPYTDTSGDTDVIINTTAGPVIAMARYGIAATNQGMSDLGSSDLSINTSDVSGGLGGINALNEASAYTSTNLTINSTQGTVSATGATGIAIYAINRGASAYSTSDLSLTTADVTGAYGIYARNYGAGELGSNLTVDTTAGTVTATSGDGIYATNYGASSGGSSDLSVTTGHLTSAGNGIDARNYGVGHNGSDLTIDITAGRITSVTGRTANGIYALNEGRSAASSSDLTITTGDISANFFGISATNDGDGGASSNLVIDTTAGSVTINPQATDGRDGITASNFGYSFHETSDLSITTADVTGALNGIYATNFSEGYAYAEGFAGASMYVDTSAGTVEGTLGNGIQARHRGISGDGYADLSITTANVTGGLYGIKAFGKADGYAGASVFIDTTSGSVTGLGEDGIEARNEGESADGRADLIITTAAVTGAEYGIFARNEADGYLGADLIIDTSNGAVVGQNRDGINAKNRGNTPDVHTGVEITTDLVITTGMVTGDNYGIYARNYAEGYSGSNVIINSRGSVTGLGEDGIYATNAGISADGRADLSITTHAVSGATHGIFARNEAYGFYGNTLTIDSRLGAVTGDTRDGIDVRHSGEAGFGSTDMFITTAGVTGNENGIRARSNSAGSSGASLTIHTVFGAVQGNSGVGLSAVSENEADEGTTDLTITTADVEGALDGIYAFSRSNGASGSVLTIDTTAGSVEGRDGRGIGAVGVNNSQYGAIGLDITTADVTSSRSEYIAGYRTTHSAIVLGLAGSGYSGASITLDTTAGTTSSPWALGMLVTNRGIALDGLADTTVKTGDVEGLMGLELVHEANGAKGSTLSVDTTAGAVTSSYGFGISAFSEGQSTGGAVDISVRTGDVTVERDVTRGPEEHPGVFVRQDGTGRTGASIDIDTTGGTISNYSGHAIFANNSGNATHGRADTRITTGNLISNGLAGSGVRAESFASGRDGADLIIDTSAGTMNGGTQDMSGVAVRGYQFGVSSQGTTNLTITTGDIDVHNGAIRAISNATAYFDASIVVDTTAGEIVSTAFTGSTILPVFQVTNLNTSTAGSADTTIRTGTVRAEGSTSRFGIDVTAETDAHVNSDILVDISAGSLDLGIYIDAERSARTGSAEISVLSRHPVSGVSITDESSAATSANITVDTTVGIGTDEGTDAGTGGGTGPETAAGDGIRIDTTSQASAGTVHIDGTFGNIVAEDTAVRIMHRGSGHTGADLTVDTTAGAIVGGTMAGLRDPDRLHLYRGEDIGINADHAGQSLTGTTNLRVTTSGVTGGATGIRAVNAASGHTGAYLTVDTTGGAVAGLAGAGIDARQTATSAQGDGGLSLRTGAVSGATYGIYALSEADSNTGADTVIDTTAGRVTGIGLSGIRAIQTAYSYAGSASLSITTGAVEGALDGISAHNTADSATGSNLTIDTGAGLVVGRGGAGIYASNSGLALEGTTDLALTVGNVMGRTHGVHAVQHTDGDLTFRSTNGDVGGYVGYGLNTLTNGMGAVDIALTNSGIYGNLAGVFADHGTSTGAFTIDVGDGATIGNISGLASDLAIRARSEATGLTLTNQAGGAVRGTLDLTEQDDVFNNAGTWRTAGGINDFGGGNDVVNNSSLQTLVVGSGAANQVTFMNNLELFNNTGRVTFVDGFASDRLVLSGNFDGTGGVMEMEFDAATGASDRLVVNGDVVGGPTTVVLGAIGGTGGLTGTGQNDGISLVQVAGTTSAADFQLAAPAQADVFLYDALSLGSDNVWRVQSNYLPTISGYEVYPSALINMTKLAPYRDRQGARQVSMGQTGTGQTGTEVWIQTGGTWLERDQEGSASGTSFEQNFHEITAGVDFATLGAITAGVNLRFSEGSTLMNGPNGASKIKTEGYGIGASLTWHGANGVYVDTQARYMTFTSDLLGSTENSGEGLAASVEVGHSFTLPSDGWSMTHRAQFSYSAVDFDDMRGSLGETVRLRDGESLTGRFGLALNRDWSGGSGGANSLFGSMDLVHELMPDTAVDVTVLNTTTFARSAAPTWIEFGLGGTIGLSESAHFYGAINASHHLGGSDSSHVSASFGFNMRW